ncbi:MAG: hypothetical protein AAFN93_05225 [Bacteroidota bacterium]
MMKIDEEHINRSLNSLDSQFPELQWGEDELWERIESKISTKKKASLNYWWYSAAASVILGVVVLNYFLSKDSNETISYSAVEEIEIANDIETSESLDIETLSFISENCERELHVCKTPEFQELKSQLDEASTEIDNLNEMISRYGDSPELVKSKIQIENFRSQVMRKLVQIITS